MHTEGFSLLSFSWCLAGTATQNFLKIAWICTCAKKVVNFVMRRREGERERVNVCHHGLRISKFCIHLGSSWFMCSFLWKLSWASFEECVLLRRRLLYFAVPFPISFRNEHDLNTIAHIFWGRFDPSHVSKYSRNKMKQRQSGTLRSQHISPKPVEMQFVLEMKNNLQRPCMPPPLGLREHSEYDRKGNVCLPTDRHHSRMNWTPCISQSRNQLHGCRQWTWSVAAEWDLRLGSLGAIR